MLARDECCQHYLHLASLSRPWIAQSWAEPWSLNLDMMMIAISKSSRSSRNSYPYFGVYLLKASWIRRWASSCSAWQYGFAQPGRFVLDPLPWVASCRVSFFCSAAQLAQLDDTLILVKRKRWVWKGEFRHWEAKAEIIKGGGEFFGNDEIWLSNFRFIPQILGLFCFLWAKQPPQMAATHKLRRA